MADVTLQIFRGTREQGNLQTYTTESYEGQVVLDAIHETQARGS